MFSAPSSCPGVHDLLVAVDEAVVLRDGEEPSELVRALDQVIEPLEQRRHAEELIDLTIRGTPTPVIPPRTGWRPGPRAIARPVWARTPPDHSPGAWRAPISCGGLSWPTQTPPTGGPMA
jgi:hypothetical protein